MGESCDRCLRIKDSGGDQITLETSAAMELADPGRARFRYQGTTLTLSQDGAPQNVRCFVVAPKRQSMEFSVIPMVREVAEQTLRDAPDLLAHISPRQLSFVVAREWISVAGQTISKPS